MKRLVVLLITLTLIAIGTNIFADNIPAAINNNLVDSSNTIQSVAISDSYALIGKPSQNPGTPGEVDVISNNNGTWTESTSITPPNDVYNHQYFGYSVAIYGDTVVIGCPATVNDEPSSNSGVAYIYSLSSSGASLINTLKCQFNDPLFGISVGIYGDTAIVGDPSVNSAYFYNTDSSNASIDGKLSPCNDLENALGWFVGISGSNGSASTAINSNKTDKIEIMTCIKGTWENSSSITDVIPLIAFVAIGAFPDSYVYSDNAGVHVEYNSTDRIIYNSYDCPSAISSDGNTVIIGDTAATYGNYYDYIFTYPWVKFSQFSVPGPATAIALSNDGLYAITVNTQKDQQQYGIYQNEGGCWPPVYP